MKSVERRPSGEKTPAPKTKFCEVLATVIPICLTAAGSLPEAVLTRFSVSTAAGTGSRVRWNVAVNVLTPSLVLEDVTDFIASGPVICGSKGVGTAGSAGG